MVLKYAFIVVDVLDNIDTLIPKPEISPIQLFEQQGKQLCRARTK